MTNDRLFGNHFDAEQLRIVHCARRAHTREQRPTLVIAGPGSGKTRVLAGYVFQLLASGAAPQRILVTSFGTSAVREIQSRIGEYQKRFGLDTASTVRCVTLHAAALQQVRSHAEQLGLRPNFTILEQEAAEDLFDQLIAGQKKRLNFPDPKTCTAICGLKANARLKLGTLLKSQFPEYVPVRSELRDLISEFETAKRRMNVVDFDDLLRFWLQLLRDRTFARHCATMFDHVLVDEFQDLSCLQFLLIKALRPSGRNVVVFGDDAQSINQFRGASIKNFLSFETAFSTRARLMKLTRNYRSTKSIIGASNAVISRLTESEPKRLWTSGALGSCPRLVEARHETDVAKQIAEGVFVGKANGYRYSSIAVLGRTGRELQDITRELARAGIPVRLRGSSFRGDQPVFGYVLDLLTWCENPLDILSGQRTLQQLGGLAARLAARTAARRARSSARNNMNSLAGSRPQSKRWKRFCRLLESVRLAPWKSQVRIICHWLIKRSLIKPNMRPSPVLAMQGVASRCATRADFLAEMKLTELNAAAGLVPEDRVTISTIHAAKGGEWHTVYVVNAADGSIPSRYALSMAQEEEERRILYVAMTRAQNNLTLFVPKRSRSVGQGRFVTARTRFITRAMLPIFDVRMLK